LNRDQVIFRLLCNDLRHYLMTMKLTTFLDRLSSFTVNKMAYTETHNWKMIKNSSCEIWRIHGDEDSSRGLLDCDAA